MRCANPWIVCEHSGQWAASLRVALSRHNHCGSGSLATRVYEVRNLAELDSQLIDHQVGLVLVEVSADNLAAVLETLSRHDRQNVRFAALLDESLRYPPAEKNSSNNICAAVVDALGEAGAVAVVKSPRYIGQLLALAVQHAAWHARGNTIADEHASIKARAWAALPWQDAV